MLLSIAGVVTGLVLLCIFGAGILKMVLVAQKYQDSSGL